MSWTLTKKLNASAVPGEIKRMEVALDPQVSPEEIKSREVELGLRVGLRSLQLFPNGGATDIVFVTLFCIAVGPAIDDLRKSKGLHSVSACRHGLYNTGPCLRVKRRVVTLLLGYTEHVGKMTDTRKRRHKRH